MNTIHWLYCPFCHQYQARVRYEFGRPGWYSVKCQSCGACRPSLKHYGSTAQAALDAWLSVANVLTPTPVGPTS